MNTTTVAKTKQLPIQMQNVKAARKTYLIYAKEIRARGSGPLPLDGIQLQIKSRLQNNFVCSINDAIV